MKPDLNTSPKQTPAPDQSNVGGCQQEPCSDCQEDALRWVLTKIRERQREIREITDKFRAAGATESADVMNCRYNELHSLASEINEKRYQIANPNASVDAPMRKESK